MKVNLDQQLKDFDGDPIEVENVKEGKEKYWTLKKAVVSALAQSLEADKNMAPDKAVARWKLAMRLHGGGEQELTPEELVEIRERLPKCYTVLISGQACELLKG